MSEEDKCYQIYDWYSCDEELGTDESSDSEQLELSEKISKVYMMYMFGVSEKGHNACIKVTGFEPFFWIELPELWMDSWTTSLLYALRDKLPRRMKDEIITDRVKDCIHLKYRFRGYQWEKKRKFMKLEFKSEGALRSVYYRIKEGKTNPSKRITINTKIRNHVFPIYEKNITPVLRMLHIRNIKPAGWVSIKNAKYTKTISSESNFRRNWTVDWKDVYPVDKNSIGPIKVASFDIEADSSHGDFPVAKKDYIKLAQNMYEEFVRCQKQKQRISPSVVKRWIKCAFREYYPSEKYDDNIKSSIQTIILKENPSITNREFDTISQDCYRELSKYNSSEKVKAKDIAEGINNLLCSSLPDVLGDKVIQIGTVLYRYGKESTTMQRHIVTLGGCDNIPGVEVVSCETVSELYSEWVKFMAKVQPNIITGYNIFGFDFKFLWECAEEYGCVNKLVGMGPMKHMDTKLGSKELFSAAMGHNFLYYFEMPGMVTIDLLKVIQREHNLSSYKLDDVSNEFINGAILNVEFEENKMIVNTSSTFSLRPGHYLAIYKSSIIGKEYLGNRRKILEIVDDEKIIMESCANDHDIEWPKKSIYWCVGKDNVSPQDIFEMQRGTDSDRAIVAKYCVQDCELCLNLMQKLEIITNNVGMSNVCLVPFSYLFMRGQMIKTLSLVSSECSKENYMIPELPGKTDENSKDSYEGAEVLEPKPAIFLDDPVSVLDYSSLYPSSMIGSNISHDTIIKDKIYLGENGAKLLEEMGIQFEDISYDNYDSVLIGKTWHKRVNESEPIVTCRYVQPPKDESGAVIDKKRGILPRILMKLLKARKETRAMIKKEKDPFRRSVLDGLQLAYKITANSLYGGVGAEVSALYYKDIAASTTAVGRAHLHLAKDYVNEHYPKAEVVYGDTDSIFVNFQCRDENGNKMSPEKALQASIDKSIEVEKGIQPLLQYPHCLEYEKTFLPFVLLRKKGYIGNKYEFDVKKYKQTSMGVVTKRRDNAPILKYVYDGIINRIINDRDIDSSIGFLKDCIDKILSGHFPMQYFIITKKLNAFYAFPDQIVHKALADRMGERDPGNKPQSNDRIPYVYVNTKSAVKLQGDRVEHPDYIKEHNLKIDYLFYITNQIVKPCCQVYALTLENLRKYGYNKDSDYFERLEQKMRNDPKKSKNIREKLMTLKSDEAYKVLFEKRVKIEEGKKFGQRSITNYFQKRC
uniref:DNA-directed DNA polymerase n=1 Tax=viral metagenome TaxID=1070528 RepID=A0A6C0AUT7_9ZZZZ|tara:strand:- start:13647 stop:17258 length:3612 start_codon:yes stop_codon:yes gene_type:complete